jgi:predicted transposase/invertase (TIGR01784 family)
MKGKWDFRLSAVYTIAIVDFVLFDNDENYFHNVKLIEEQTGKVFYDKLVYKYLELPKFTKNGDELKTNFERWVYLLKKLPTFENRPPELQGKIFDMLFRAAEISQLTTKEMEEYKKSITEYADVQDAMLYAREKGSEEGFVRGINKIAKSSLKEGLSVEIITRITGLTPEQIKQL